MPLAVKLVYSAFAAVLIPIYLRDYGPTNFLYFCDVALLMTIVALWRESPLWASMPAVGILLPQTFWILDFLAEAAGFPLTGMTHYMFDAKYPLFTRGLSTFHLWLPLVLLWLVARLGYDRRALWRWTLLSWALLTVCYIAMPPPPAPADNANLPVNINYVYGLNERTPQTRLLPTVYFLLVMLILPTCVYLPTHWTLNRLWGQRAPNAESKAV